MKNKGNTSLVIFIALVTLVLIGLSYSHGDKALVTFTGAFGIIIVALSGLFLLTPKQQKQTVLYPAEDPHLTPEQMRNLTIGEALTLKEGHGSGYVEADVTVTRLIDGNCVDVHIESVNVCGQEVTLSDGDDIKACCLTVLYYPKLSG